MAVYKHIIKKWGPTHENVPVTDSDQGEFQPDDIQWMISLSYATRRADSIQAAKEILLNAEPKFPKEPAIKYNLACYFCQMGDIKTATSYLKKAFEIDLNWRMTALEDKDLKSLWESF
jgi:hypothetical protein